MEKITNDLSVQVIFQKYERLLSPLGNKVLASLITLKNERKNNNFRQSFNNYSRCQNKSVITLKEPDTPRTVIVFNDDHSENINDENNDILTYRAQVNDMNLVISSNDLLETASTRSNNNDIDLTTVKNVDLNINASCYSNLIMNPRKYSNNEEFIAEKSVNDITPNHISWDNMFDDELFEYPLNVNDDQNTCNNNADNSTNNLNSASTTVFSNEHESKREHLTNICDGSVLEKRKRKMKVVNNDTSKAKTNKLNKGNENKILRKEKYTTTIKNWLSDIDTTNNLDKDFIDNPIDNGNINKVLSIDEKQIYKLKTNKKVLKEKKIKKSIQAQLANKGGIMKYRKPDTNVEVNIINTVNDAPTSNVDTATYKDLDFKVTKEKKNKAKFVAPIKSQTPVKNVTYKVITMTATLKNEIENLDINEGVMTLIYSNGFSQLNKQHTEDDCKPEGIMFCFQDIFYYIEGLVVCELRDTLCGILTKNTIISFDAKSVLGYLMCMCELPIHCVSIVDAKIGASLLNPDDPPENFSALQNLIGFKPEFTIATQCTLQKTAWYVAQLRGCWGRLRGLLEEQGLWKVFADIEMKILPIVAGMEHRGISVDTPKLKCMESCLLARMKEVEAQCHAAAGKVFQLNSTAQLRAVLYDELRLDTASSVKIRETICKGVKSTSEAVLRSLAAVHPLPALVLEFRHLHKAHATFLAGIAQHVQAGLVKPTWDQTAAVTGRIACNNPNLQAIPKVPFNLHLFPKDDDESQSLKFRSVYVARSGYALLAADFKHIECRVFAAAAADTGLLAALDSRDLFTVLAAKWLHKLESAVSAEDRERTKRIVYASLYGAGTRRLMEILELPYDQTLSIMSSFNRTFPSLKSFGRSVVSQCEQRGGRLTTASGRARTFTNIASADQTARAQAERQAVNFIIQGTAADLCKMAMVLSGEGVRAHSPALDAHLLLQLHDELVWEVLEEHLDTAAGIIRRAMEGCGRALGARQPLPVAMQRGAHWGDMAPYQPTHAP